MGRPRILSSGLVVRGRGGPAGPPGPPGPPGSSPAAGIYPPEAYGAVGNGVANDTAAVQAAIDAAYANGGGIVLLAKRYSCAGDIVHKGGVTVMGVGVPRVLADEDPTITDTENGALIARDSTFRYVYGTSGSSSGHDNPGPLRDVIIDGMGVGGAAGELFLAQSAQGLVEGCHIINGAADGLRLNGMCQNTLFLGNYIGHHVAAAVRLLQAATFQSTGGSTFLGGWIGDAAKLLWSDTDGTNVWPHTTSFVDVIFEQRRVAHDSIVHVTAGQLDFRGCIITRSLSSATAPTTDSLMYLDTEASSFVSVTLDSCAFNGGDGGGEPPQAIRCHFTAGISLVLDVYGVCSASDTTRIIGVTAGAPAISNRAEWRTSGTPNPTTHHVAAGGAISALRNMRQAPDWYAGPDNSIALSARKIGEAFHDWTVGERGQQAWWDSATGSLIASLEEAFGSMHLTGPWMVQDAFGFFPAERTAATGTVDVDALAGAVHTIECAAGATVNLNLLNPSKGRFVIIGILGNGTNTLTFANPIWWSRGRFAPSAPPDGQWTFFALIYAGATAGWRELWRGEADSNVLGHIERSANNTQTINTGSPAQTVLWQTSEVAARGGVSYDAGTGVFTVTRPGRYAIGGFITLAANATGRRQVVLRKNPTGTPKTVGLGITPTPASGAWAAPFVNPGLDCVAGDTFDVQAFQDSGGGLLVSSGYITITNLGR